MQKSNIDAAAQTFALQFGLHLAYRHTSTGGVHFWFHGSMEVDDLMPYGFFSIGHSQQQRVKVFEDVRMYVNVFEDHDLVIVDFLELK